MAIKVVCAGLGRTGTNSLKLALEQLLGEPCYHMYEVGKHEAEGHAAIWADAYQGKLPDWDALFAGYAAAVDWPAAPFWREISEAYPEALIMLSLRDADSWWESASSTIFRPLLGQLDEGDDSNPWTRMFAGIAESFTPDLRDEAKAKAAFTAYYDSVRRDAPAERLLEWRASDGWEPICERLGVPVPDEPFPKTNTREEMQQLLGLDDGGQTSS